MLQSRKTQNPKSGKRNGAVSFAPVGVVGLGYVGLPVACAFAKHLSPPKSGGAAVIGFDVNPQRIDLLRLGRDETGEVTSRDLRNPRLEFTTDPRRLRDCRYILVTVPTPINEANEPDLGPLRSASEIVGKNLSAGATVIYESTVYPGVTEEFCLPILEKFSGLKLGDFKIGYSPERINPGDQQHTLDKIIKVVSACDAETLDRVVALYSLVAKSGVHRTPNIKTAEAAKVIENVQRDLNIALMNELSLIFERLGLHTQDVLDAAATKWNFHRYHPGLVGGHCIGVDPYYLTHRALHLGYHPAVILAGRAINDAMARHVGELMIKTLTRAGKNLKTSRVLVFGLTFKENVPDIRNSKVAETIATLRDSGMEVVGCEPLLNPSTIRQHFGIETVLLQDILRLQARRSRRKFDAVLLVNAHRAFRPLTLAKLRSIMASRPILIDLKNFFSRSHARALGFLYQSL